MQNLVIFLFIFNQTNSAGFSSGEYEGKKTNFILLVISRFFPL